MHSQPNLSLAFCRDFLCRYTLRESDGSFPDAAAVLAVVKLSTSSINKTRKVSLSSDISKKSSNVFPTSFPDSEK